jgi:Icc protein
VVRLIQITDTHLFADRDGHLLGHPTRSCCEAVFALARKVLPEADALLLTGDLVHDERAEGYLCLKGYAQALGLPYYALPGNHDSGTLLARWLDPGAAQAVRSFPVQDWRLVLVDSTSPGRDGGRLGPARRSALDSTLAGCATAPCLVCLHHHPVPVGSPWLDAIGLEDGAALLAVMDRHPQVRGVLWGHIHQAFNGRHGAIRLMGSPSTCVQFLPGSPVFALDSVTPGLRWLDLYPDGRIETGVLRLVAYPESTDSSRDGD